MGNDSVIYTVGTALNRALSNNVAVQVLVEGQWIGGHVAAVDGYGVVLASSESEHSVIRMESVSAVKTFAASPHRPEITTGATPMPARPYSSMV